MSLFQVQTLKVLVNLSSNPDMIDEIVQAQVRLKPVKINSLSYHPDANPPGLFAWFYKTLRQSCKMAL